MISSLNIYYSTTQKKKEKSVTLKEIQVTDRLASDLFIQTEWPVKTIIFDKEKDLVQLQSSNGETIQASRVVVTVPLPILKDSKSSSRSGYFRRSFFDVFLIFLLNKSFFLLVGVFSGYNEIVEDIEFVPPLPIEKLNAIETIGIDNAVKIIMKFSHRFWPSEVHGVS